jgi:hypothetical protein
MILAAALDYRGVTPNIAFHRTCKQQAKRRCLQARLLEEMARLSARRGAWGRLAPAGRGSHGATATGSWAYRAEMKQDRGIRK